MTTIQAIRIREYEERTAPKTHIVFRIEIQVNVRLWYMWKRYSEFVDLDTELTTFTRTPPPAQLPPKISLPFISLSERFLQERTRGLEAYLSAIVHAEEKKWRDCLAFKTFLGIPVNVSIGQQLTHSALNRPTNVPWLDQLHERYLDMQIDLHNVKRDNALDLAAVRLAQRLQASSSRGDLANPAEPDMPTMAEPLSLPRSQTYEPGVRLHGQSDSQTEAKEQSRTRRLPLYSTLTLMVGIIYVWVVRPYVLCPTEGTALNL